MDAAIERLFDDAKQDIRSALRGFRKSPGFAVAAIVTLALGIGANAAMFGILDRLMFRPYAYLRDPAAVHRVYWRNLHRGSEITRWDGEYRRYLDLQQWTASFSQYAAFAKRTLAVGRGDAARERPVATVSASFFEFFDAQPALGRFFNAAEDATPRGGDVAVLGNAFWKSEFGARDVLGERLQVGEIAATIIGVAPEGFVGTFNGSPPAVYLPITTYAASMAGRDPSAYFKTYSWRWVEMMVRRKPNVSLEQASADATRAARRSWESRRLLEPDLPSPDQARPTAVLSSLKLGAGPDPSLQARTALWVAGVAAVVLLIAIANVANLLLTRALQRRREAALRLALGAPLRRLAAQSLTESLLLAIFGGAAGLLTAEWGGTALRSLLIDGPDEGLDVLTDWRTLGIAAAITIAAGILSGLAPALEARRGGLSASLKRGGRQGTHPRSSARSALLVAQASLSLVLLVGAGLFVRSYANVRSMPMGYDAEPVLLAGVHFRGVQLDDSERIRLGRALLRTAQALPGVECVSSVMTVPLLVTNATYLSVPGVDSVEQLGEFSYQSTTPDYFRVMGTHILRGRGITEQDRADTPRVAVVSLSMAQALWPGQDPIGRRMRVFSDSMPWTMVVGVAEDIVQNAVTSQTRYHYYLSSRQFWPQYSGSRLLMRLRGEAGSAVERVRQALQAEMPGQSYVTVQPFGDLVETQRRSWRLGASLFAAFGVLALLVAAVGLYGVISHDVTQRIHEIGVRMALGARSSDVVRLVIGQGARLAATGILFGTAISLAGSRRLEPLLFQESARDPIVYSVVSAVLLAVALAAGAVPAVRAARADPNSTLRSE